LRFNAIPVLPLLTDAMFCVQGPWPQLLGSVFQPCAVSSARSAMASDGDASDGAMQVDSEGHMEPLIVLFIVVFLTGVTLGASTLAWWVSRARQEPQPTWDVMTQAPTTYVRNVSKPHFKPLGDSAHGAWFQRPGCKAD